jgi:hypothetical protein
MSYDQVALIFITQFLKIILDKEGRDAIEQHVLDTNSGKQVS